MRKRIFEFTKNVLLTLVIYFTIWGVYVNVRFWKNIYVESLDQTVKVINIEANAEIHSPVSKK